MADKSQLLRPGETLDDLILGGLRVIQPMQGYRFSIDAVLLAHFADLAGKKQAVDLGTGSAVIPLLLSQRNPRIKVVGLEIQPAMVERARRTIQLNELEDSIEVMLADVRRIEDTLPRGWAELVLSNPPFWKKGEGYLNRNQEEARARHEITLNLDELIAGAVYLMAPEGSLAIIHRASRLEEISRIFLNHGLVVNRVRLVHPFADRPPNLVLVEGKRGPTGEALLEPPLIIYSAQNHYCDEIRQIYGEV